MKDRILYDISILKKYIDSENCLFYLSAETLDNNTSLSFKVKERDGILLFDVVFDTMYPITPPKIIARRKLPIENQYKDNAMCLNIGIDNWNENMDVLIIMESFKQFFKTHQSYWTLRSRAKDSEHNMDIQNVMRSKDTLLISNDILFAQTLLSFKKVFVKTTINTSGKLVCTINNFIQNIKQSNVKEIEVFKITHVFKKISKRFRSRDSNVIFEAKIKTVIDTNSGKDFLLFINDFPYVYVWDQTIKNHKFLVTQFYNYKEVQENNNQRKVGIVGMGSVGSVVLESLCEIGFKNFVIIDNDYYLPHNFHRHILPKEYVGVQKVTAVKSYLMQKFDSLDISDIAYNLSEVVHSDVNREITKQLSSCEFIIDASTDDNIIPILSSICETNKILCISGSVVGNADKLLLLKYNPSSNVSLVEILLNIYRNSEIRALLEDRIHDGNYFSDKNIWIANKSDVRLLSNLIINLLLDFIDERKFNHQDIYIMGLKDNHMFREGLNIRKFFAKKIDVEVNDYSKEEIDNGKRILKSTN